MAKKIATDKGQPKVIAKCENLNEVAQNHDEVIASVRRLHKAVLKALASSQ